ncbi:MAG: hypothetical protein P8J37_20850 [Fuerstiella sp.]|nr:hypothetical protein [Fuerstiella sp.]
MTNEVELLNSMQSTAALFDELQASSGSELAVQQKLRTRYDAALVRAAIVVQEARTKAEGKLPDAGRLWLTRVGLEQSTAWEVAQHKARRFPADEHVFDLCSGIGVDTAALLSRGSITSVDVDPAMALRCQWNIRTWMECSAVRERGTWEQKTADVLSLNLAEKLVHLDPDRRKGRDRPAKRLEHYHPDLKWMQQLVQTAEGGALKLGPASNFMQKFPQSEIELISQNGECREATVWFGSLAGTKSFRATVLPSGESISADPLDAWCPTTDTLSDYILDPDPAVVRSGLLDTVGEMHSLQRLDKEDEYLTGSAIPRTAFVQGFAIEAVLGNNPRELKRFLRANPGRDYEIKCRHLSVDANKIRKQLPRGDGPIKVLFYARKAGRAAVVVARRTKNGEITE